MNHDKKRALIDRYLHAYNTFDIDGMLAVIHADIEFKSVTHGKVNATALGSAEFRKLAEQSKGLFASRKQTMLRFEMKGEQAFIDVVFSGVLAADAPNGMKKGETLRIIGRSEFDFRDGKISRITDIS